MGLACLLIILLAAFGCKKKEEEAASTTEEIVTNSSDEVTFTSPSLNTDSATTSDTTDTTDTATNTSSDTSDDVNSPESTTNTTNTTETNTTSTSSSTQEESQVLKLAETLAELYGTYTNKDKQAYKNLQDIKPYASQKMAAWIDGKTKGAAPTSSDTFYGITTKALSSATLDSSSTSYQVLVTCQQEEITEVTKSPQKNFLLLEMYFVKENKEWKLDGAFWK